MSEHLAEKLHELQIAHDVRISGDFVRIYCDGHHAAEQRQPLQSAGAQAACYRRVPVLCADCASLQTYAEKRRAFCPYESDKPFCSECETHCYSTEHREHMRRVMRYAGPRSFHIHPVEGVKHVMAVRRGKKTATDVADEQRHQ